MSQAGARSSRGDEYQLRVALPWITRLWTDPEVEAVQVESLGLPGDGDVPLVDDIVVLLRDGRRIYVQAKKNEPAYSTWSIVGRALQPELTKARDQLEREADGGTSIVRFYSRSPFGALHRLAEGVRDFPDARTFLAAAPATLTGELHSLARHWNRSEEVTFALVGRMEFTVTPDYDEMDRDALAQLQMLFARPEDVRELLEERLRSQQARLRNPVTVFHRADLERVLAERGHVASPARDEADQLAAFARSSQIGRFWVREIAGVRVERSETRVILDAIEAGKRTILLTGEPGIGKTCVLLDVADALENDPTRAFLFVKGDRYGGARTAADLVGAGLPDDIVGQCARLAVHRPVVVVIDALDVLSLQRASGTLELFLGLMDRLATIDGVSVVAACRSFDLEFDPLLRGRTWDTSVPVALLDVEAGVAPVLERWGVRPADLDPALLNLLRVPSRLWLYGQVLGDGPIQRIGSIYELHDRYLESIGREPGWGAEAEGLLARVAARMQETRTLEVSRAELREPADVVQGLLSRGVLVETERGYAFGHQELLDVVAVRAAQRRGERLRDFVARHPALPFLRPTVRVFLHVLRTENPTQYRREVWAFVSDEAIAYHLRRLVAETMAEVRPESDDVPLLRRLMRDLPDLFERFLRRAVGAEWVGIVVDELLPAAHQDEAAERLVGRLLRHLDTWMTAHPAIAISTWRRALEEGWPGSAELGWVMSRGLESGLREAQREQIPWEDTGWLVRRLVENPGSVDQFGYVIGRTVQAWVETSGDDDVLLEYLNLEGTIKVPGKGLGRRIRSLRGTADSSAVKTEFLTSRMAASDAVITAVLEYVCHEAARNEYRYTGILRETSWGGRHSRGMMSHDIMNDVLRALEKALAQRAARNDAWWQQRKQHLLAHEDMGIRYLALQAIRASPESHLDDVSVLLTDPDTFEDGDLDSEIRELAHAAYPFLAPEVAAGHQTLILTRGEPVESDTEDWMIRARRREAYDHLIWIPRPYWTGETEHFIAECGEEFGPFRPQPTIYMTSGWVAPPVSATQIQELSDDGVLRVIRFWGTAVWGREPGNDFVGGWDQVVRSIREAASNVPERALRWLDTLIASDDPPQYRNACIEGISTHLRARFGGLHPSSWAPVEPLPDGPGLARALLQLLEHHRESWIDERTLAEALEACANVLDDDDSAGRLTEMLVSLSQSPDPDETTGYKAAMEALNTVRGKVASAAAVLATQIVEGGRPVPKLLSSLLHTFAQDRRAGVRWAVLHELPRVTHFVPDLGWALFEAATANAGTDEWQVAELTLYHNYHRHFDRVGPALERIRASAMDVAGDVYGKIATLSLLSGHIDEETIFCVAATAPPAMWSGVAEVFAHNLGNATHGARCADGLIRLLTTRGVPDSARDQVLRVLGRDGTRNRVPRRVVEVLLQGPPDQEDHSMRVHAVAEWAAEEARYDALSVLPIMEQLASGLESGHLRELNAGAELMSPLTSIMREADETDDPALIARVVALQDRLLRLGIDEVDRMLDAASRP